jgi:tRNA pseudouridine38-40 synthase
MTRTVRLDVQYEGTAYHGWQKMPGVPTIQGELERALGVVMRTAPDAMTAAGRTDAGVHAAGQVVSFSIPDHGTVETEQRLLRGCNALLPSDIAVVSARAAVDSFDARRCALGRRYVYTIHNAEPRPVFSRATRWHVAHALDVDAMQQAAQALVGEHDFDAFRAAGCQSAHARRYLWRFLVTRHGPEIGFEVRGNAFVRSQVRVMVGTLVEVGRGRRSWRSVEEVLQGRDRTRAGLTAPAQGLCLAKVYYPEDLAEADIPPQANWPGFRRDENHR